MHTDAGHWKRLISEANDAIGAARDAMSKARSRKAWREASEDLDWWIGRKAFAEAGLRSIV